MKNSEQFHEALAREEEIKLPSERSFAKVMFGACVVFACLIWWLEGFASPAVVLLLWLASLFAIFGLLIPEWLRPLNKAWMKLGALLHTIVNPIIMLLLYAIAIVPAGLIMKLLGKDPLKRRYDAQASTYWIPRTPPGPAPETMKNQF